MSANSSLDKTSDRPRGPLALATLGLFLAVLFVTFVALGTWQVQRRAWKLDLIARVDQRIHAPVTAPPGPDQWAQVTAAADEYRRVRLQGAFLYDHQTYVWASTDDTSGYWVLTPLHMADDSIVLVNRGFVPHDWCGRSGRCGGGPQGETSITGLLRISEHAAFLRHNDPARDSWYTSDVAAIAAARGLENVAPYYVDEDAASDAAKGSEAWPKGGLTLIEFPNNHLVYLITWYLLALMVAVAGVYLGRNEYRLRKRR